MPPQPKSRLQQLMLLRNRLRGLDPTKWSNIESWAAGALAILRREFPDHVDDFKDLAKEPRWVVSLLARSTSISHNQRAINDAAARELQQNNSMAQSVKRQLSTFINGLIEAEEISEQRVAHDPSVANAKASIPLVEKSRKVFVVHGHDGEMKESVARTLTQLDLIPIILHEQPSQSRTLIEKFESESDVGYAVVILSDDDVGCEKNADVSLARRRPRQNVILELGYFVGKLTRSNVFALKCDTDIELPSDYHGVGYTTYDKSRYWKLELVRELKSAGYTVDANALVNAGGQ